MSITAVVGAQWGDEGKGKIVDLLAQDAEIVVRYQGGANAGHTVVNNRGKFALHLIPCGIFNPATVNIIGTGTVVDVDELIKEMDMLASSGIAMNNLKISERAHMSLPIYPLLERQLENARGVRKHGSTLRGISPAYAAKALRIGVQMGEFRNPKRLSETLSELLTFGNQVLVNNFGATALDVPETIGRFLSYAERVVPHLGDTLALLQDGMRNNCRILLEGQLGTMRDLDWGIYPYVTSSNPLPGGAAAGAGIPPHKITGVLGVVKAFSTCVGAGPFPTELHDDTGRYLREVGQEFGATTGRPRRCGWLDAVALKYASMLNGFTEIAVTKLDTLDGMETLKVCTGYLLDGERIEHMPLAADLFRAEPIYEEVPGWKEPTSGARSWNELPKETQHYVELIEGYLGAKASIISVGPEREATFWK
ncbi:MAG: adenylosuccinate synthase [Peptococcaceae bacterium]|nr:adenylosuccinate synthase [Peptococcaceae bacterium]